MQQVGVLHALKRQVGVLHDMAIMVIDSIELGVEFFATYRRPKAKQLSRFIDAKKPVAFVYNRISHKRLSAVPIHTRSSIASIAVAAGGTGSVSVSHSSRSRLRSMRSLRSR